MPESQFNYQQSRQQMLMLAAIMFVSIVAAIVASTAITMSLMRGEVASAITAAQMGTATNTNSCVDPEMVADKAVDAAMAEHKDTHSTDTAPAATTPWHPATSTTTNNTNNTTTNNTNTYNVTDNSHSSTVNNTDNSKGKTIVTNNSTTNNTVNQNGLVNVNVQDLSQHNTQTVTPVNIIDNLVNSQNTDNSMTNSNNEILSRNKLTLAL